jgi:hypothetical protein
MVSSIVSRLFAIFLFQCMEWNSNSKRRMNAWMNEYVNWEGGAAKGGIDETNCGDTTWGNACVIWKRHKSSRKTFSFMISWTYNGSLCYRTCFEGKYNWKTLLHTMSKASYNHLAS